MIPFRTVEIAAFYGDMHSGSATLRLEEGSHLVKIPLRYRNYLNDDITIIADPFNEYCEVDESNNISSAEGTVILRDVPEVLIPSPAEAIELTLTLPSTLPEGIKIRVYSIDGRLVTSLDTEGLRSGITSILLGSGSGTEKLPAGMYSVCIEGLDSREVVRKVIILGY
jgi:hypothetical protein